MINQWVRTLSINRLTWLVVIVDIVYIALVTRALLTRDIGQFYTMGIMLIVFILVSLFQVFFIDLLQQDYTDLSSALKELYNTLQRQVGSDKN